VKNKNHITILLLIYSIIGFCQSQHRQIDSLKRVLKYSKIDSAKANIYNNIADKFKESNPDSTGFYAAKANVLSQKINYTFGQANANLNIGNSNIILGNYKLAIQNFRKAQTTFEKLLDANSEIDIKRLKNGLAKAYASQGIVYSQQSNYFNALDFYQKALAIYLEINQKPSICKAYNNIGIVYKSQLNYLKAIEYFQKALKIQQEIGEQSVAVTLTNIGVIYAEQGNKSKVLEYFDKAKKLFENNDNKRGFALLNNYYGDYYLKEKNYPKAEISYNQSLKMYEELQNKFGASLALYNLGNLNCELKKYDEAIVFANKSLTYAKEIGVLDQTFHSEKLLSELYGFKNDSEKSFFHYKNYVVARDSISNQENNKKLLRSEMENEYKSKAAILESESKRKTQFTIFSLIGAFLLIALIFVIYNRMQVKKRLTLQKEVAEYEQKALHLQMNPHFVFNCLGSISSFIVQNGTDSALKYLSKFSKLMRLTLEYSKGALIPIDKEIESLQNYLELEQLRFHNKFQFSIISTDKVEFNMGIPPLLIQPFVENAILHGMVPKEGNGRIDVKFDVENGQFICSIKDDGIGLTESKMMKENSVTAHKSMALEITKKRLEIMETTTTQKANIEITELKNNNKISGTEVILRLPKQYIE
jgi:tetratricopeptide (TPR) repeat protein